jgi:hypothetical protein
MGLKTTAAAVAAKVPNDVRPTSAEVLPIFAV